MDLYYHFVIPVNNGYNAELSKNMILLISFGQTKEKCMEKYWAVTWNQGFHCRFIGFSLSIIYSFEHIERHNTFAPSARHLNTFGIQLLFGLICAIQTIFRWCWNGSNIESGKIFIHSTWNTFARSYPRILTLQSLLRIGHLKIHTFCITFQ